MILKRNPEAIINSRLQGYGDYATPEQGLPVIRPVDEYWELCMTINDSWGYQQNDRNYNLQLQDQDYVQTLPASPIYLVMPEPHLHESLLHLHPQ